MKKFDNYIKEKIKNTGYLKTMDLQYNIKQKKSIEKRSDILVKSIKTIVKQRNITISKNMKYYYIDNNSIKNLIKVEILENYLIISFDNILKQNPKIFNNLFLLELIAIFVNKIINKEKINKPHITVDLPLNRNILHNIKVYLEKIIKKDIIFENTTIDNLLINIISSFIKKEKIYIHSVPLDNPLMSDDRDEIIIDDVVYFNYFYLSNDRLTQKLINKLNIERKNIFKYKMIYYSKVDSTNLNKIDFTNIKELKGIGLGYYLYKETAKKFNYISSNYRVASSEAKNIWNKLIKDDDFYSFFTKDKIGIIYKNISDKILKAIYEKITEEIDVEDLQLDNELNKKINN